jgi:iron complex transport system permease protein
MGALLDALRGVDDGSNAELVVRQLRLPRLLGAVGAGAALGVAGAIVQDVLRNPVASPELLGVASSASLGVALLSVATASGVLLASGTALVCGVMGGALVIALSMRRRDPVDIVLVGAAANAVIAAAIVAVLTLSRYTGGSAVNRLFRYLIGSFSTVDWSAVHLLGGWCLTLIPLTVLARPAVELLRLGEDAAEVLGLHVVRARVALLGLAAAWVAPVVAVAGPIGFVALATPHIARAASGRSSFGAIAALSALIGAAIVVLADAAARLAIFPHETPVGLWTVAVGAPTIVLVLARNRTLRT